MTIAEVMDMALDMPSQTPDPRIAALEERIEGLLARCGIDPAELTRPSTSPWRDRRAPRRVGTLGR